MSHLGHRSSHHVKPKYQGYLGLSHFSWNASLEGRALGMRRIVFHQQTFVVARHVKM